MHPGDLAGVNEELNGHWDLERPSDTGGRVADGGENDNDSPSMRMLCTVADPGHADCDHMVRKYSATRDFSVRGPIQGRATAKRSATSSASPAPTCSKKLMIGDLVSGLSRSTTSFTFQSYREFSQLVEQLGEDRVFFVVRDKCSAREPRAVQE